MLKVIAIFISILLAAYACHRVVRSAGAITAYVAFSWVPLALGFIWANLEFHFSPLNPALPLLIIIASLSLSLVGLPVILITGRRKLPAWRLIGAVAAAFLYGIPALLYLVLSVTGTR